MICRATPSKLFGSVRCVALAPLPDPTPPSVRNTTIAKPNNKIKLIFRPVPSDEWYKMGTSNLVNGYLQLSKHRLSLLVATTAVGGYMIAPTAFSLSTLAACTVGTTLLSAAANTCNQLLEAPYDAQMKRTQSRVLVVHKLSPLHALTFAVTSAAAGTSILFYGCNPLTAGLGLLNIGLYAGVYTPMKRYHIGCTWVGAVVGAIPPLMGFTAATGSINMGAIVLATILYSWQFPHFNGLSWNLRGDYSRAGYRVMCVTDEDLCRKTTIRHAVALTALCSVAAPLSQLSSLPFALYSLPFNVAMMYFSYKFYRTPDAQTSRNLFRYSLIYLPALIILMVIGKYSPSEMNFKKTETVKTTG